MAEQRARECGLTLDIEESERGDGRAGLFLEVEESERNNNRAGLFLAVEESERGRLVTEASERGNGLLLAVDDDDNAGRGGLMLALDSCGSRRSSGSAASINSDDGAGAGARAAAEPARVHSAWLVELEAKFKAENLPDDLLAAFVAQLQTTSYAVGER